MHYQQSNHRQTIRAAQETRARSRFLVLNSQRLVAAAAAMRGTMRSVSRQPPWLSAIVPKVHRFSIAGEVRNWNPTRRELQVGGHTVIVAPSVSVLRLARQAHVLLAGYQSEDEGLGVVTRLIVRHGVA